MWNAIVIISAIAGVDHRHLQGRYGIRVAQTEVDTI